jgi:hypothetical protein
VYFALGLMAVASPYAVFRAVDVIWPPVSIQPLQPLPPSLPVAPQVTRPRKRLRASAVQGELFPSLQWAP